MLEQAITVAVPDGVALEARYTKGTGRGWGVVTHPHPRYGGSMDNNVVHAALGALRELGLSALRFNFRGVGRSTGGHGGGPGEIEDLCAAVAHLRAVHGDDAPGHLVGYSFGAWIALQALPRLDPLASLTLISPPLDFMPLQAAPLGPQPTLVVCGERDEFCSVATLQCWFDGLQDPPADRALRFLKHGDHFHGGREGELDEEIRAFLADHV